MNDVFAHVARLRKEFDGLRPTAAAMPTDLQRKYDIEQTYASNAIEGNTLTLGETAELIEHGITVGGKALKDHLEALDHFEAVQWMREVANHKTMIGEATMTELHRRIVARSRPDIAGTYAQFPRRVSGSPHVFPNAAKVPALMTELGSRIETAIDTPEAAFDAHYRLVSIHPFDDGNGRTARLLANMMLIRSGYVPVTVRLEDRTQYISAIMKAQLAQDDKAPEFQEFMHRRLADALTLYVDDLSQGRETRSAAKEAVDEKGEDKRRPAPSRDDGWSR